MNQTYKWIAYGLDMDKDLIVETTGVDMHDSHQKAVNYLISNNIDFDTVELYKGDEINGY